ncbi:uncharacterized protein LOC122923980 isoform X2 [Bufo gargarizans]|uniref:uncharacterized protein LOC122923980 isoform X1 n=1 Tax=Bufo gargarizans TaxID=30331 RepID=UPI001CF20627|nr:uncharacterized protein LOC122923980 isoform X1 [Bufo gargarizans]XP_044130836.1 uncharacterized protein LOC122923980 isoform X2 [Bufo gargarizans]
MEGRPPVKRITRGAKTKDEFCQDSRASSRSQEGWRPGGGAAQERVEARRWCSSGAGGGQEVVQLRSGWRPGGGAAQERVEARRWCSSGAGGGQEVVQLRSGWRPGGGATQERVEARRWCNSGAGGGQEVVQLRSGWRPGGGAAQERVEARRWCSSGAGGGQEVVQLRSGWRPGGGAAQERVEARRWCSSGAGGGQEVVQLRSGWRPGGGAAQERVEARRGWRPRRVETRRRWGTGQEWVEGRYFYPACTHTMLMTLFDMFGDLLLAPRVIFFTVPRLSMFSPLVVPLGPRCAVPSFSSRICARTRFCVHGTERFGLCWLVFTTRVCNTNLSKKWPLCSMTLHSHSLCLCVV